MIDHGGPSSSKATQRRREVRRKMFEPVTLLHQHGAMRAHFLDLSCSGALAHCETPPAIGRQVTVELLGARISGKVMWLDGKRFGMKFTAPLTRQQVDALIAGRKLSPCAASGDRARR